MMEEAFAAVLGLLGAFVAWALLTDHGYFVQAAGAIFVFFAVISYFATPVAGRRP